MSEKKKALRREILLQRENMEKTVRKDYDERIYNNLKDLDCIKNSSTFLIYASSPREVDTRRFIAEALRNGKTVAIPKCEGRDMRFIVINSPDDLVTGSYGVDEPASGDEITDISGAVCIVPALRFDRNGYRLGWGGGFYDRFLSVNDVLTVGICYEENCGDVPADKHDIPVDTVITENGIYMKKC